MSQHSDSHAQPKPTGDGESVTWAVIEDMIARRKQGMEKYGTELKTHNGRRAMVDLYQELLDATMYIKQRLMEQDQQRDMLRSFTARENELVIAAVRYWHNSIALDERNAQHIKGQLPHDGTTCTELRVLFDRLTD